MRIKLFEGIDIGSLDDIINELEDNDIYCTIDTTWRYNTSRDKFNSKISSPAIGYINQMEKYVSISITDMMGLDGIKISKLADIVSAFQRIQGFSGSDDIVLEHNEDEVSLGMYIDTGDEVDLKWTEDDVAKIKDLFSGILPYCKDQSGSGGIYFRINDVSDSNLTDIKSLLETKTEVHQQAVTGKDYYKLILDNKTITITTHDGIKPGSQISVHFTVSIEIGEVKYTYGIYDYWSKSSFTKIIRDWIK